MKNPTWKRLALVGMLVAMAGSTLAACAEDAAQAQVVQSKAERDTAPGVASTDLDQLVFGNGDFAFELYQNLRNSGGNLFFSPYSISSALAMTYAGARGETERQMADTLHSTLPQGRLHPAFNALDLSLTSAEQEDFKLHIANAIWGQTGYSFLTEFLDVLAQNYGAGLRLSNFQDEPEASRQVINDWISEQTEERIQDLIPEGGINTLTRLVLANAIYFDAEWVHPFEKERTQDGVFNTLDGGQVMVPLMAMGDPATLSYTQGEGFQAVELPYKGDEMSMLVLVPDAGQFEAFEGGLRFELVQEVIEKLESKQVALTLPKFSYESEFSLAAELVTMGMSDAFRPSADFSGMDGTRDLFISDVFHKAFVAVDEAGTEAAAATAVVMRVTSLPVVDVQLNVDRPFVFMIRDVESGTVLFVGRVLEPGA